MSPTALVANGWLPSSVLRIAATELASYTAQAAVPLRDGIFVRAAGGHAWLVSGGTRSSVVPAALGRASQRVFSVTAADLALVPVGDAPTTPFYPGAVVNVPSVGLAEVDRSGELRPLSGHGPLSWGWQATDVLVLTDGAPAVGEPLGLRDGTLANASGKLFVASAGVARRVWDLRERLSAYGPFMVIREMSPRIWMKLAAIALSFTSPLVLTTYFLVNEGNLKIDFTQQEQLGDQYLRPASRLLVHVELHRSAVRRQDAAQVSRTEVLVDTDLHDLIAVDRTLHNPLKTTSAALSVRGRAAATPSRLATSWEAVKLVSDVASSEQHHERLLGDIRTLITAVGDSSNLILDPDLDTYYSMDALLLQEPELIDELSRLGDTVDQLPAGKVGITAKQQATLAGSLALLRFHADALKTDLGTAFAETKNFNKNDELAPTLSPLLARAVDATTRGRRPCRGRPSTTGYDAAVRDAIDANTSLWSGLFDQEDRMLNTRGSGDLSRRQLEIVAVGLALLLSVLLTCWMARRISRNVGEVAAAAALAAGDLSSRARVRSRDEVGVMANAFNTMAESLDALVAQVVCRQPRGHAPRPPGSTRRPTSWRRRPPSSRRR